MKSRWMIAAALTCAAGTAWQPARACDAGIVRDAAFDQPRDSYRLCVIANADDPNGRDIQRRLSTWLESAGASLNLELIGVDADAPDVRWSDYGVPSIPPELPVVVLVGKRSDDDKDFFVDYWQPEPTAEDLDRLRSSPARDAIQRELVKKLAVIVHVPGQGSDGTGARDVIGRVCQEWENQSLGISVVSLNRNEPRERLLLSFIGVAADGPDWVGVAFGRGKFMAPLEGEEISEAGLTGLLDMLAADCTCMQTPSRLGVDVLMAWDQATDDALVRMAPRSELAGLPLAGPQLAGASVVSAGVDTSSPNTTSTLHTEKVAFWIVGGLILLSCAGSAVILWRKQRHDAV